MQQKNPKPASADPEGESGPPRDTHVVYISSTHVREASEGAAGKRTGAKFKGRKRNVRKWLSEGYSLSKRCGTYL